MKDKTKQPLKFARNEKTTENCNKCFLFPFCVCFLLFIIVEKQKFILFSFCCCCCFERYGLPEEVYSKIELPVPKSDDHDAVPLNLLERQLEDLIIRRDGMNDSLSLLLF